MGSINFSIHPLFFVFGLYYALKGKIFIFLIYTFCAFIHELGHSFIANSKGYKLDKIVLMPFGAVVKGNLDRIGNKNMIEIAIFGPLVNLAVGLIFISLWWIFPQVYPYTEQVVSSNLSLAIINLIPAYPLDGGRILFAFLANFIKEKNAQIVCKILGVIFGVAILGLFILSCFKNINISLLGFSVFIFLGTFEKKNQAQYIYLSLSLNEKDYERGLEVNKFALSVNSKAKKLLSLVDVKAVNQAEIYENGKLVKTLYQKDIENIINCGKINQSIKNFL